MKYNTWSLYGRPKTGHIYDEMCQTRKVFKSRLKWCQDHQDQIKMDILASKHKNNDFRGFWKQTSKFNVRPSLPVSVEGVCDPEGIANIFRQHFFVESPLATEGSVSGVEWSGTTANTRFSAKVVANAIKGMARGRSPGHDGLSIEHLRYAGPHICRLLSLLFNFCVSHSYLPTEMLKTIVVPIVKNKTGDVSSKYNYRPISLATVIAKVFDGVLNAELEKFFQPHDNQFGFRSGLSTESAVLCLKHTVRYYTARETPVYACFLDLSSAFDLVSYDILWRKLSDINVPQDVISTLKYWYENQVNSVRWAGSLSQPYVLNCGVRQGGLTSPALFNLYVNALIVELSGRHVGCHVDGVCVNNVSYADDMVLLSASVCGLRELLSVCESYAITHGLNYNVKKTELMVFEAGSKRVRYVPPVRLYGCPLNRTERFKYLGHIVTSGLCDDADIERERRALSVRANMIARRFKRCSLPVKVTLFRAFCTSFYTCSLWAKYTLKAYRALRVQYNNAFRVLMGLGRRCSASGMFAQARVDCFYSTMRKRAASLVSRVRASPNSILAMIAGRVDCRYMSHCGQLHVAANVK